jgi:hypothetical protein
MLWYSPIILGTWSVIVLKLRPCTKFIIGTTRIGQNGVMIEGLWNKIYPCFDLKGYLIDCLNF